MDGYQVGTLVISRQGRDRGRYYVVLRQIDDRFVLVSDGERHPVGRPKRKNVRHLQAIPSSPPLALQLTRGGGRAGYDEMIKGHLQRFISENEGGGLPDGER